MGQDERSDAGGPVVLVEPARARLVGLAADVVGRLPVEDVPPTLRAVARFTPAKRQRLGAAALASALDADEGFRERLADAVGESLPDLVAAVRDRTSTAAADPVDIAVVAYLVRPEGWTDVLADANRRWVSERRDPDDDEVVRLASEVRRLTARARAEPARLREAVDAATTDLETEIAREGVARCPGETVGAPA